MTEITTALRRALLHAALAALVACGRADEPEPGTRDAEAGEAHAGDEVPGRLTLSEEAWKTAGIETVVAAAESGPSAVGLDVPGQVEFDPRRVAMVSARTRGRVDRLLAVSGDHVGAGQPLALLYSPEFLTAQQDYVLSLRRARQLEGTPDAQGAEALAQSARRRLEALGVSAQAVERLAGGEEPAPLLPVLAPFAGSVMDADVVTGASVAPGDSLFRLADLSVVDVIAQVPERALPLVFVGQPATIEIAAFPGMRFDGSVEVLREELNPETRTVEAVIHAANRARRLRPGMYATVRLTTRPAEALAARAESVPAGAFVAIPASALVTDGDHRILFVEVGPRTYERREVDAVSLTPPGSATPSEARVLVRSGVRPGERVVVRGAFTLKSELTSESLGEHGH